MRQLRFLYLSPHDFPDVPDCDGSCGGGGPCLLHAGLCCPADSLDAVMVMENLCVFTDDLLEDLKLAKAAAALLPPRHGKGVFEVESSDADDVDAAGNMDDSGGRGACSDGAPRLPPPARAALSDSSWTTTTSSIETTESSPPPLPPPVSRLVVPRKKRDKSVKCGKRLWSLDIPNVPSSRDNPSGGGGIDGEDDDGRRDVDGVRRRRLLGGAARPRSRRTQRACSHCESTETPQWRAGPNGPGTLCNACGIRYNMNKLLPEYRPSTSPSFQSDRHSNRHRKVVELRLNNNRVKERIIADNNMPPPARESGEFMDVCKYVAIIKGEEGEREDDCQQYATGARPW